MNIYEIIQELNKENGSLYKTFVMKKYKENKLLQRVLQMTYDKVKFTYGLSVKHWHELKHEIFDAELPVSYTLEQGLDFMDQELSTRKITGNAAITKMHEYLVGTKSEDTLVLLNVLNRDLRINFGRTMINKVFPGLINKPCYMRCAVYSAENASKINPEGAIVQLKADGTYREFTVENGEVLCNSRSGEEYDYPLIAEEVKDFPDGHYFGELTVVRDGVVLSRSLGNGEINSDEVPHKDIILDVWDYVTLEEYSNAAAKIKNKTPYFKRLNQLREIVKDSVYTRLIETYEVNSVKEALLYCNQWMNAGLEGAIYKDANSVFRDGTNPQQQKLKLIISLDLRVVGFQEGTPGTKREKTFGAILFESDDGMIKGKTSGFTDKQLEDFNSRREELIGTIITVECNDLTMARDNDYYALSHPRFDELRSDKTTTDTIERALELKQMAMELK